VERITAQNSTSGNVVSYGWNPTTMFAIGGSVGTLEVEFGTRPGKANAIYRYADVPQERWIGLLQAPSAGNYLNSFIKNTYACTKVQ
jgi:hypothetical protein